MNITVYTKPGCIQCQATYRALTRAGLDYTTTDITKDPAAYHHVVTLGYQQVPVVETPTTHWSGFRPDNISALAAQTSS